MLDFLAFSPNNMEAIQAFLHMASDRSILSLLSALQSDPDKLTDHELISLILFFALSYYYKRDSYSEKRLLDLMQRSDILFVTLPLFDIEAAEDYSKIKGVQSWLS